MKLLRNLLRNFLGVLSPASMWLKTWRGEFVGSDHLGHKYYRANPRKGYRREQRWVMYPDVFDASAIPPEYHGWLHYQTDNFPSPNGASFRKDWQAPAQPNFTGTNLAYQPTRTPSTGDYQAWKPE